MNEPLIQARRACAAALLAGAAALLAGCATPGATTIDPDPYQDFNRSMMGFNAGVDAAVLGPASRAWDAVAPQPVQDGVSNFGANLNEPVTFLNDLLQGEGERALDTAMRFIVNTTFGLGGLIDVAGMEGIERHSEDFGQTLAVWGVDSGPYVVAPLLGSTSVRDLFGFGVTRAIDPIGRAEFDGDDTLRWSQRIAGGLNARARVAPQIEALRTQPDPYTVLKRVWGRNRGAEIANGETTPGLADDLPDFDTFPELNPQHSPD